MAERRGRRRISRPTERCLALSLTGCLADQLPCRTARTRTTPLRLNGHPGRRGSEWHTTWTDGRTGWEELPASTMDRDALPSPLVLERRLGTSPEPTVSAEPSLQLALSADERTRLRGLRQSRCGQPLLLQLPRGEALVPGEWLAPAGPGPGVQVQAAAEPILVVRTPDPLTLLQAAYHLGNRHVALEIGSGELRLLQDSVLEQMLQQRGLTLERQLAPFLPETGAYGPPGHPHSHHAHHHEHGHHHSPMHDAAHDQPKDLHR